MEPSSEYPAGRNSPDLPLQISNPRSSPLSVRKDSHTIKKTPAKSPVAGLLEMTESRLRLDFKLRFINSPQPMIYTHSNIKAENGSSLAVELVDAATSRRVTTGPLSSSRLEIVVLDADLTEEVFNRNIVRAREGKRPLLAGDVLVALKAGVVVIGNVSFTDNSSWLRSQMFRLGARAIHGGVKEAKSEAFKCMGDSFHEIDLKIWGNEEVGRRPLGLGNVTENSSRGTRIFLESEVWKLEGIPETGVEALAEEGIHSVKDLRRCIAMDPDALHRILGRFVSKKTLERIVSHAMQCVLEGVVEFYAYEVQAQGVFLLFNSVYDLVQVSFDGVTSLQSERLTSSQKQLTDKLKHEAYENVNRFVPVYRSSFVGRASLYGHGRPLWQSKYVGPDSPASGSKSSDDEDSSEVCPPDPSRDKYDVIIRYNKRDISNSFISHLHASLCGKGISAAATSIFKPVDGILDGIPACRVVITFLPHTCVSSNLLEFCDRLPSKALEASQIFYRVSPSNLISYRKKLEKFFLQHHKRMWWNVLQQVSQMPDYILIDKYVISGFLTLRSLIWENE